MTYNEMSALIQRSVCVSLGYTDEAGRQNIRRVFCPSHKGLGGHLISTNTSSAHVQSLLNNDNACLYFSDDSVFEGLCLSGRAIVHFDREYKAFLWAEGDEKYYPQGVEDEDYCVIEFVAESGRFYKGDSSNYKGDLSKQEIEAWDTGKVYTDRKS